ncbi:MAG: MinD/ParA family protein [Planctomycetota bacterium]|nr:MinD/ParA family protein [Planctomycetota bacterium]
MKDQAWKLRSMVGDRVQPAKGRARVLAITSGKGGVGKTNISVGLAITAATTGLRTVLIDGDLGLANIDVLLDLHPRKNLGHLVEGGASLRDVLIRAPGGFQVLPGASGLSRVADLGHSQQQVLFDVLGQLMEENDLILIDTGAGISRSVVDLCTTAGEVLVVTTPEPTAIVDAYAMLKVFSQDPLSPKCWLVVNQAQSRGEAQQVMGRMRGLARQFLSMEIERAGAILHDPRVPASVRRRQHFSLAYPSSPAAQGVRDLCEGLGLSREKGSHGFLHRLKHLFSGDLEKVRERAL